MSFGTVRITDLGFADDAVIFAEATKFIRGGDVLNRTIESIPVSVVNM